MRGSTWSGRRTLAFTLPVTGEQLSYGLVLLLVVSLVARGRLSVGYYAAFLAAAEQFRDAVMWLLVSISRVDDNLRYVRDLFDYMDLPEERQGGRLAGRGEDGEPGRRVDGPRVPSVRFEGVSFAYPGSDRPALDGIDFTLAPGERIALVGENGAGKSTLAKLLLGLYAPSAGRILVDGVDLKEIEPGAWREHVAAVFQDYVKYSLTLRENIAFGDLARIEDEDALRSAAVRSGAHSLAAELPAGYDTVLGKAFEKNGRDLSIGQWQKLAVARAYLRNGSVLVLDEPTAALDARAEVEVYRQFRDMAEGKSVLLISHRLGSARLADRILVLEGGRIEEEGTHAGLMERNGKYAELYSIQAGWYR